ncbi:HigA family addiction module antitoxin [Candidatus Methylomirabilis sp.]|uniref:HigA family addiction module antitoxin n=1 Tax=Candidatus Methylomirabilis sp. TaxID=2032687 RepID=UPI003C789D14
MTGNGFSGSFNRDKRHTVADNLKREENTPRSQVMSGYATLTRPTTMKALTMKNPPHPGFLVRVDCLEPHRLSVTEGVKILGVSRSALSNLVNQNADLSWDMAIRLAKAFGGTPEGWMRLQFQYDAAQVEERARHIKVKTFAAHGVCV